MYLSHMPDSRIIFFFYLNFASWAQSYIANRSLSHTWSNFLLKIFCSYRTNVKPRKSKLYVKTRDRGRIGLKSQSFWLMQILSPDYTLLPSTAASPVILGVTYHSTNTLSWASNSHFSSNNGRDSIGSSNFSTS